MAEQDRVAFLRLLSWIDGKDDGVTRIFNSPEEGTKWYVVSTKWLNNWKRANKLTDDLDSEEPKPLGEIDSQDIIDTDPSHHISKNYILKPSAKLGIDYEILPKKAWSFLKSRYSYKQKIKRKSISVSNDSTFIEITLFRVRCLFIFDKSLKFDSIKTFYVSKNDSISLLVERLHNFNLETAGTNEYWTSKLWKLSVNEMIGRPEETKGSENNTQVDLTKGELEEREKTAIEKIKLLVTNYKYSQIQFPGQLIEKSSNKISECDLADNEIFVLETKRGYMGTDIFKEKPRFLCEFCRKQESKARQCLCKKFYYCNDICEDNDKNYHCCRKIVKVFNKTQFSKMGVVGLQNLGNTCYMNSGLQCLSHTIPLTEYILDNRYLNDVNNNNPIGSKNAELVTDYVELIKEMWYGTGSKVSPWGVKKAFGDFANQFVGFFQQDSQEMLGYLIDGVHEDLNRVKKKPVPEDPSGKQISEDELAERLWINHKSRNDSIIVDLMHGQYRSEIECPDCGKVSVTFDPFLMLTLPIPETKVKNYEYVLMDLQKGIGGSVSLPKGALAGQIRDKACEAQNISDTSSIIMAEMTVNSLKRIITANEEVQKKTKLILYKSTDTTSRTQSQEETVTLFIDFRKKSYGYSGSLIGHPHLLTVPKEICLGDLYKQVYIFINKLRKIEIFEEETFAKNFPNFFGRTSMNDNYFSLKVHNPYQYPCAVCDRVACAGCSFQNDPEKLSFYLSRCKEDNLRISVVFSERVYDLSFIPAVKDFSGPFDRQMGHKGTEKVQLDECFELFLRKEQLDENNTVYCSVCREHKKGFKKMGIRKLPQILIIHLKRFKQKSKYMSSKNSKLVEFPMNGLDMGKYCLCQGEVYDLYAVSNHFGSLEGGHYTAFAKDLDGIWRDYDDSSVSAIENVESTVVREPAYVLFYQKRETKGQGFNSYFK